MNLSTRQFISLASIAHLLSSCALFFPEAPSDQSILDGPIQGLDPIQNQRFIDGDEAFGHIFSPSEGLGPVFNGASCSSCHPGDGRGHPELGFIRFGHRSEEGEFSPLSQQGGPQLQDRAILGYPPEQLPDQANVTVTLIAPPVTGLGYLEAVDDETLLSLADPEDEDGDGISGRVSWVRPTPMLLAIASLSDDGEGERMLEHPEGVIGRFGRKAGNISLLHQTIKAYNQDMGLTSSLMPIAPINVQVGNKEQGSLAAAELSDEELFAVEFYLRALRTPDRRSPSSERALRGEEVFEELGCDACHISNLKTGRSNIKSLDRVTFHPYTDLLLHDLGEELDDGYVEVSEASSEWRTPPLWGLGLAADFQGGELYLMHDGRARSLQEAIELHGGEATGSRARFRERSEEDKAALFAFLESL